MFVEADFINSVSTVKFRYPVYIIVTQSTVFSCHSIRVFIKDEINRWVSYLIWSEMEKKNIMLLSVCASREWGRVLYCHMPNI